MEKTSIMVVDDEPYIRRSLSFVLKQEKYSVITLEDGQLAWEKLCSGFIPDIIFLDVMMPRLSGFDLCKLIKSDYRFKNIYVIMLTARWQEADRKNAAEIGADEYITKPFSPSRIIRRVQELLGKKQELFNG
ncbi:MAG TPA: response regulator [Bacteroidetes bacterium]|nr:response regulator [Bacteroidota bacterium]